MARKKYEATPHAADSSTTSSARTAGEEQQHVSIDQQLAKLSFVMRQIHGDGNCLFRALADQLTGQNRNHLIHRREVVDYMRSHRDEFEPFLDEGVSFQQHLRLLSEPGTYAGNDAIVAFARLHNVTVVIHQLNQPPWTVGEGCTQLHISYHNGEHYNSIRRKHDQSETPADIKLKLDGSSTSKPRTKRKSKSTGSGAAQASSTQHNDETAELELALSLSSLDQQPQLEQLTEEIVHTSGATDRELIRDLLLESGLDYNYALSTVLQTQSQQTQSQQTKPTGIWSESGTGTRVFGTRPAVSPPRGGSGPSRPAIRGTPPRSGRPTLQPSHLSNKERKAMLRQEKERATQAHPANHQAHHQGTHSPGDSDSDGSIVVDVMKI